MTKPRSDNLLSVSLLVAEWAYERCSLDPDIWDLMLMTSRVRRDHACEDVLHDLPEHVVNEMNVREVLELFTSGEENERRQRLVNFYNENGEMALRILLGTRYPM